MKDAPELPIQLVGKKRTLYPPPPPWQGRPELYPGNRPENSENLLRVERRASSPVLLSWWPGGDARLSTTPPQPGYRPEMYPSSSCMVCACPEMIQRTRSPIDTTPTATPSSTT